MLALTIRRREAVLPGCAFMPFAVDDFSAWLGRKWRGKQAQAAPATAPAADDTAAHKPASAE